MISTLLPAALIALLVPAAYVFATILAVAWFLRRRPVWRRGAKWFLLRQLKPVSASRIWWTVGALAAAMAALFNALSEPLALLWLALVLFGYLFFVTAATASFLARIGAFRSLWSDPFCRLALLVAPVVGLFLAKGYGSLWVGKLLRIPAANLPMTHFAATGLTMMVGLALGFVLAALAFEALAIVAVAAGGARRPPSLTRRAALASLLSPDADPDPRHRRYLRASFKGLGLVCLALMTMMSFWAGSFAAASLPTGRFGGVLLSAIAFEFDAGPAHRCALEAGAERDLAERDEPVIRALPLSSSQEKALLVRRGSELFDPVRLKDLRDGPSPQRRLIALRMTECFELKPAVR